MKSIVLFVFGFLLISNVRAAYFGNPHICFDCPLPHGPGQCKFGPIDSDVHTNHRPSHQQVQPHSDPSRSPILGQPSHLEPQPHRQNALKRQIPLAEQGRPASSSPNQRKKPRQGDPAAHPIKPEHPQHSPVNSLQQQQPGPSGQSPSSMLHPHHDPNHRSFHRYGCSASTCSGRRFYTVNEFGIHVTGEHMIPVDVNEVKCPLCPALKPFARKAGNRHCKKRKGHPQMRDFAAQPD